MKKNCKTCKRKRLFKYFYKAGKGKYLESECKECHYERNARYRLANPEKTKGYRQKWIRNNPIKNKDSMYKYFLKVKGTPRWKYEEYKGNAKRKGRIFNLSFEQFKNIISKKCHYCNVFKKIGIDRKNNKLGYTVKNSLPCCWKCNNLKRTKKYKDFINKNNPWNQKKRK